MDTVELTQLIVVEALDAEADPVEAQRAQAGKMGRIDRPRVSLDAELRVTDDVELLLQRLHNRSHLLERQEAGCPAAEENSLDAPARQVWRPQRRLGRDRVSVGRHER